MSRNLSDWLDSFITLTESNPEPPLLFRKWAGISAIASALQRKVRLELGLSLTFYPNLYIVLIGPPATRKGTAMNFAANIIEQIPNIRTSAQATSLQALIRRMKETNLTDTDLITGQQQYHSSLTILSKEFTVFLGYHNRELITALCDWYDCDSRWSYETISRKKEEIIGVWVNLFAGTTPDALQSSLPMESIGMGLTSRIIFVCEEKREQLVIIPSKTEDEIKLQQALINDLEAIALLSGKMQYDQGFLSFYFNWATEADNYPPFKDKKFQGYCERRRRHFLTLSMVCNASRTDSMMMELQDAERAASLLDEVEVKMGTVFKGMGRSDLSSLVNDSIVFIVNSKVDEIPLYQYAKHFEGDMDKLAMDRVLMTLEAMGTIKLLKQPGIGTTIVRLDK